jgi:hypothetical protein
VREAVDLFKIPNDTVRIGSCADLIEAATASLKFNRSLLHNQVTSFTHKFESLHPPTMRGCVCLIQQVQSSEVKGRFQLQ